MTTEEPPDIFDAVRERPVGGPVWSGWREGTLTRAKELESLCAHLAGENPDVLARSVLFHIEAARQAAFATKSDPVRRFFRQGSLLERAMSNLDAAEAHLLSIAPPEYLLGQLPGLLRHARSHLVPSDPRRQEFERIARRLDVRDPLIPTAERERPDKLTLVREERERIVSITRAASSAALREQVRVRSFRNILVATALAMTLIAFGLALTGFLNPTLIPMCFAPEESTQTVIICPTEQSAPFPTQTEDIDRQVLETVTPYDLFLVELVGMVAAAVASAAAIRGMRGSSERYGLPVALAALKLPTGAVTAFLGVLLMRGQFVPGLSALDTSAQILAWALVFGYAQQLFTRLVDRQGQTVLDSVRGADKKRQ
ncbi:hypothetical protein [Actinophytocola sp.]|uniref:hypothetical protein n=1 Tax=Actinophytocola sp. TaxID=1872138 RepID=UPI002ED64899